MKVASISSLFAGFSSAAAVGRLQEITNNNWSGAIVAPGQGNKFDSVTGTFTIPKVSGGSKNQGMSVWVGFDGYSCQTAIAQVGIYVYGDGSTNAWYEWYPDDATDINLSMKAGDAIRLTVTASKQGNGATGLIENLTTGKSYSKTWSNRSQRLCQNTAEWIVEDFLHGGSYIDFVNYGSINFNETSVSLGTNKYNAGNGPTIRMISESTGNDMSVCTTTTAGTINCQWKNGRY